MGNQNVCGVMVPLNRRSFRSPLARAVGLGSAKSGVQHWWAERITAVALVPLCLWFVATIITHTASDHAAFVAWISTPLTTSCMVLFLIALFHHTELGLQVVIEDYVHSDVRFVAIIAVRLGCYGLSLIGIIATLLIALRV
jgi:succinate dehydrogenase / fumarate reductase membrane anchor subunit